MNFIAVLHVGFVPQENHIFVCLPPPPRQNIFLCLCYYVAQMVMLYNDPEGENIFTTTNGTGRMGESDYVTEISSLRKKVTELQETLTKVKVKIIATILR